MSQHSSWVVKFSLEILANVSLHMHIGNAMLHNSPSCAWINPSILFVCFFLSPAPLIVFLVAMKKCAMPLSEPLVYHRPRSEMFRRSWCNVGTDGVSSHYRRTSGEAHRLPNVGVSRLTSHLLCCFPWLLVEYFLLSFNLVKVQLIIIVFHLSTQQQLDTL